MSAKLQTTQALAQELAQRIELRTARVAVVGLGYVGLPLAETFAWGGYPVIGFDIDAGKVARLQAGESYIGHIPSERIADLVNSGRFSATTNPACFEDADAIVICVPTPLTEAREPDLSYVEATGRTLVPHLRPGQLVVLESSTYPGTTDDRLRPILEESGLRAGRDFFLAYSPEREDPGNPVYSTRTIPKVVGGYNTISRDLAVALYEPIVEGVVPVSSNRVAEACKILENTYRAVNIALVNELKIVFDAMGIDIWEVIDAARTKPFGFQAFYPGPGLGGHCIPIDPFYLTWMARQYGISTRFIELAGEVNTSMPAYVVQRIADALNDEGKPIKGSRVCILGVAYKKDVDDPRESPAFPILEMLQKRGALVSYNDPHIPVLPLMRHHTIRLESEELTEEFLASQDCVVIVTNHSAYDYDWLARHARLVVDTRNALAGVRQPACRICKA
ncbi:MAG: nucleotide sugar dehydrogenase [Gemmataceae bacterium]|nr:nucleotide sugar dehydrogenase [Gemmataceae bacterium]MDW8265027.1 nucleotide sugar dehydrogenase [Gemmataceae bacterium]